MNDFELTVLDLYYKPQVNWLPPSEYACTTAAIYDFESANYAKNICYAKSHLDTHCQGRWGD